MSPRPLHRTVISRQHTRLAGALVFDRRAMGFRLRNRAREDAGDTALDAFTVRALSLRGERISAR